MRPASERYKEIERITLKTETGVEMAVLLKVNDVRIYRIEYWLDGKMLKPERFEGRLMAKDVWDQIKQRLQGHTPKLDVEVEEA